MTASSCLRVAVPAAPLAPSIAATVIAGLTSTPKQLPPWLFYDARGSTLFEAITRLPEYYLTRAEREIFAEQAGAILDVAVAPGATVNELGAGTATKTQLLLEALITRDGRARYVPVDVSGSALAEAQRRLANQAPALEFDAWEMASEAALPALRALRGPRTVLLIGSSIGNYDEAEAIALLSDVRAALAPGDRLLLGTDLRKPEAELLPAYDDAAGVTAAFNRNLLVRINRELDADFHADRFRHVALWNAARSRVEMHLESVGAQRVRLASVGVDIAFADGERIHTESSVKYDTPGVTRMLARAGLAIERTYTDDEELFAVHLARPA